MRMIACLFGCLLSLTLSLTTAQAAVDVPSNEYVVFYAQDALGSPVAVSDHKGQVMWYENSEPYGKSLRRYSASGEGYKDNVTEEASSRLGYTGHINDTGSGLTYMKARYYDPEIGRFYSNDPVGFSTGSPAMFNRYSYVFNNPYRFTDPTGMEGEGDIQAELEKEINQTRSPWSNAWSKLGGLFGRGADVADDYAVEAYSPENVAITAVTGGGGFFLGILNKFRKKNKTNALRPVGQFLESIEDVMANPELLKGVTPALLMSKISEPEKWVIGEMNKTRNSDKGFTLRERNSRGTDYTDRYIQFHPGSRRHYNGRPYWKVSSGNKGTVRFPLYEE